MQRRKFLKNASAASAAFTIVPSYVLGKNHTAPSDTLYVAAFGVGGRGRGVIEGMAGTQKVKFVALCDVDDRRAKSTYELFPDVKRFKDFRKVYDAHLNDIAPPWLALLLVKVLFTNSMLLFSMLIAPPYEVSELPLCDKILLVIILTVLPLIDIACDQL